MFYWWVEERSEALRLALRVKEFPTDLDLLRLVDWLEDLVVLVHDQVAAGSCRRLWGGGAELTLPERLTGRKYDLKLAHELGHALLTVGMGPLLRQTGAGDGRAERLARLWDAKDEALAQAFVMAWFLPSALVRRFGRDEFGLSEASGCDGEMVRRRRLALRGQVITLTEPPKWSAFRAWHVIADTTSRQPLLCVARRGSVQPQFSMPAPDARSVEDSAAQISADLVALTEDEFAIKYGPWRCGEIRARTLTLDELRAWAGGSK